MSVSQRIKVLLEELKISQKDFSVKTGISEHTISNAVLQKTVPRVEILVAICESYPNLNPVWLLLGREPMWLKTNQEEPDVEDPLIKYHTRKHLSEAEFLREQVIHQNKVIVEKEEQIILLKEYIELLKKTGEKKSSKKK